MKLPFIPRRATQWRSAGESQEIILKPRRMSHMWNGKQNYTKGTNQRSLQSYRAVEAVLSLRLKSKKWNGKTNIVCCVIMKKKSYVMAAEDCFYCSHLDIGSKILNLFLNIFRNQVIIRTCDPPLTKWQDLPDINLSWWILVWIEKNGLKVEFCLISLCDFLKYL